MIITQKITLLAFQVHDGEKYFLLCTAHVKNEFSLTRKHSFFTVSGMCQKQEKLTEDQRRLAVQYEYYTLLYYL